MYIFFIPGNPSIKFIKYPKTVLGSKSNPKLKNLKPFIKVSCTINTERLIDYKELIARSVNMFLQDSQIVQLECKNLKDQEEMLEELEDKNGSTQFFLADPAGFFLTQIHSKILT